MAQPRVFVVIGRDGHGSRDALAFAHAVARDIADVAVVRVDLADARARSYLSDRARGATLFVIPILSRPKWLGPFVNWHALRLAHMLARRAPVATVAVR